MICVLCFISGVVEAKPLPTNAEKIEEKLCQDEAALQQAENAQWYQSGWVWIGGAFLATGLFTTVLSAVLLPFTAGASLSLSLMGCGFLTSAAFDIWFGLWLQGHERDMAKKCQEKKKAPKNTKTTMTMVY